MKKISFLQLLIVIALKSVCGEAVNELRVYLSSLEKILAFSKDLEIGIQTTLSILTNSIITSLPEGSAKDRILFEYTHKFNGFEGPEFLNISSRNHAENVVNHHAKNQTLTVKEEGIEHVEAIAKSIKSEVNDSKSLLDAASDAVDEFKKESSDVKAASGGNTTLKNISEHLKHTGEKLEKKVRAAKEGFDDESRNAEKLIQEIEDLFNNEGTGGEKINNQHQSNLMFNGRKSEYQIEYLRNLVALSKNMQIEQSNIQFDTMTILQPAENIVNAIKSIPESQPNPQQEGTQTTDKPHTNTEAKAQEQGNSS